MGSLNALVFKTHKVTLPQAAVACGVDPDLLLRVDQRRQPLPHSVVVSLAALLKEDVATVEHAAGLVTPNTSPRALTPLPPSRDYGDTW